MRTTKHAAIAMQVAANNMEDKTANRAYNVSVTQVKNANYLSRVDQVNAKDLKKVAQRIASIQDVPTMKRAVVYTKVQSQIDDITRGEAPVTARAKTQGHLMTLSKKDRNTYNYVDEHAQRELYHAAASNIIEAEKILREQVSGGSEAMDKAQERQEKGLLFKLFH